MKRWVALLGVVVLLATMVTPAFAADQAFVRVINVAAAGKTYDVLIGGTAAFTGVAVGTGTDYSPVAAGSLTISVVAAGTTTPSLGDATLDAAAGKAYTIFIGGKDGAIKVVTASDDGNVPVADKAVVRPFDNVLDVPTADFGPVGKPVIWTKIKATSAGDYKPMDPGKYSFMGYISGTTQGAPVGSSPLTLEAGKVYTLASSAASVMSGEAVKAYLITDPALPTAAPTAVPTTGGEASLAMYLLLSAAGVVTLGGIALRKR